MKILKFTFACLLLTITSLSLAPVAIAHPGNTSYDGGHYCWTRCDYWGEVYGERHFHNGGGGGPVGPTYTQQGITNGAEHANNNATRIKSSAEVEGRREGFVNGNGSSLMGKVTDSNSHCSQTIKFTSPQPFEYTKAFQSSYTSTCIRIYEAAYSAQYDVEFIRGQNVKKALDKEKEEAAAKKAKESSDDVWYWLGGAAALYGGGALISYYTNNKEW